VGLFSATVKVRTPTRNQETDDKGEVERRTKEIVKVKNKEMRED
jgi:hypothetical protein